MERKQNKNEALEALDFIINVLKEHEKDLDRLISQLGIITESLGETGEITGKIEKIEDRITTLQGEITNLIKYLATPRGSTSYTQGTPVNVKCKQWEDFKNLAAGAETVSYLLKEAEKSFQADALKNGRIVSYTGEFPQNTSLLKLWLSKELDVTEEVVFEGALNID
ncbi:hypothetical protein KAS24_05075 [Candidatus Bathyarchaeota archaeon]|jgi:hypothetical protein|nr:hypothetical protein [Candidatus Bathyarchaeota archaeon]